jgi:molybdopterin-guanine dinucleotide biosynthesis protein A
LPGSRRGRRPGAKRTTRNLRHALHPSPPPLGAILAGGASRRFGSPKALAPVGGVPVVERVRRALLGATPDVVLIANDPSLFAGLAPALPVRGDPVPGAGPLGGILAALRWAEEEGRPGALCFACDLPFVPASLARHLAAAGQGGEADAVVPESPGRRGAEPLCAFYSVRALAAVEALVAEGPRPVFALLDRVRTTRVPLDEVRGHGDPAVLFLNLNTPGDHQRAKQIARATERP